MSVRHLSLAGRLHRAAAAALLVAGFAGLVADPAAAQTDPQAAIRSALAPVIANGPPIDEIRPTPMSNLYEVRIGMTLIYVDARGEYALIEGQLIDLRNSRNLTRDRIDDLQRVDFAADLPLGLAIKQVQGNGKRVFAVFEDPNCTYCRKLRADFHRLRDVTIYTFAYPILAPDSEVKSRKAWCAPDRVKAWNEMLARGTVPANDGKCENPIEQVRDIGRRLGIQATPTMFFPSGKRVAGAVGFQQLEAMVSGEQAGAKPAASSGQRPPS